MNGGELIKVFLWREVVNVAPKQLGTAQACLHWPGCAGVVPQGAFTQIVINKKTITQEFIVPQWNFEAIYLMMKCEIKT